MIDVVKHVKMRKIMKQQGHRQKGHLIVMENRDKKGENTGHPNTEREKKGRNKEGSADYNTKNSKKKIEVLTSLELAAILF